MRQDYPEFVRRNAEVIAIGPERARAFAEWWRKEAMPFIGLPDPDHSVSKLYGQQVKLLKLGRLPAQLIVDMHGLIRYTHYGTSMADIADNKELLNILEELNGQSPSPGSISSH